MARVLVSTGVQVTPSVESEAVYLPAAVQLIFIQPLGKGSVSEVSEPLKPYWTLIRPDGESAMRK